ncbi:Zinc finger, GRF-type [Sesbania bispinosa]|nr:Zinc finger, GRF-type [Sesbania bispinosa]
MKEGSNCTEKRSNRCNSSASSSYSRVRKCRCGEKLILLTSNNTRNPGRNFWRCPLWDTQSTCNYFQWADEEIADEVSMQSDYAMEEL